MDATVRIWSLPISVSKVNIEDNVKGKTSSIHCSLEKGGCFTPEDLIFLKKNKNPMEKMRWINGRGIFGIFLLITNFF